MAKAGWHARGRIPYRRERIAPTGSTVAGFSGGGCSGTSASCTVTMSEARSVTATFDVSASEMATGVSTAPSMPAS